MHRVQRTDEMTFKQFLVRLRSSKEFKAALLIFLAVGCCLLPLKTLPELASGQIPFYLLQPGTVLLAGLPGHNLTDRMPLFGTVFSAALNLGITVPQFLIIVALANLTLVFCVGCLLRGYWAGVLALVVTVFFKVNGQSAHRIEQDFYSFFLLSALSLLLLRRRENTFRINLMAGLSVGASMLVRSTLCFFPPILVFCEALYFGERSRAFILRSLVFLAASYALLVPWAVLKYSLTGEITLLDTKNASANIITSALGSIYALEGDIRPLAGLKPDDSALYFYAREVVKDPFFYALTVARRLWHIFWYFPLLFGLFLAALLLKRDRSNLHVFSLPAYFILIYAMLSNAERYFFPMVYVLPPLIVGSLLPGGGDKYPAGYGFTRKAAITMFWLSFSAVLALEALIIAYPLRAARNSAGSESFYAALEHFPNDRAVQYMKCEVYREKGEDAGYYKCLGAYSEKYGDRIEAYFVSAMTSRSPADPAFPAGSPPFKLEMMCFIIKMLREFELGDRAAAMASYKRAWSEYGLKENRSAAAPYKKDKEIMRLIEQDPACFWDKYVYLYLRRWRDRDVVKILSGIEKNIGLTAKLRLLGYAVKNTPPPGEAERDALEKNAFAGGRSRRRSTVPCPGPGRDLSTARRR